MNATDQFHTGIVTNDVEATLADLSRQFGYEWCDEIAATVAVKLPSGDTTLDMRVVYSKTTPRLEIIQSIPDTVWVPAAGSGIHHLGYWSDEVAADIAALERGGYVIEAAGIGPDRAPYWSYCRRSSGPRIELMSRALQPMLEPLWATGSFAGSG